MENLFAGIDMRRFTSAGREDIARDKEIHQAEQADTLSKLKYEKSKFDTLSNMYKGTPDDSSPDKTTTTSPLTGLPTTTENVQESPASLGKAPVFSAVNKPAQVQPGSPQDNSTKDSPGIAKLGQIVSSNPAEVYGGEANKTIGMRMDLSKRQTELDQYKKKFGTVPEAQSYIERMQKDIDRVQGDLNTQESKHNGMMFGLYDRVKSEEDLQGLRGLTTDSLMHMAQQNGLTGDAAKRFVDDNLKNMLPEHLDSQGKMKIEQMRDSFLSAKEIAEQKKADADARKAEAAEKVAQIRERMEANRLNYSLRSSQKADTREAKADARNQLTFLRNEQISVENSIDDADATMKDARKTMANIPPTIPNPDSHFYNKASKIIPNPEYEQAQKDFNEAKTKLEGYQKRQATLRDQADSLANKLGLSVDSAEIGTPPPSPTAKPIAATDAKVDQLSQATNIPSEAIKQLLGDPSSAAHFDEAFGQGMSQSILAGVQGGQKEVKSQVKPMSTQENLALAKERGAILKRLQGLERYDPEYAKGAKRLQEIEARYNEVHS